MKTHAPFLRRQGLASSPRASELRGGERRGADAERGEAETETCGGQERGRRRLGIAAGRHARTSASVSVVGEMPNELSKGIYFLSILQSCFRCFGALDSCVLYCTGICTTITSTVQ